MSTIFSRIIHGEIPSYRIAEDDRFYAFLDIFPLREGHVLVIPKGPYVSLTEFSRDASGEEIDGFFRAFAKVVDMLGVADDGYRTIANSGLNGGQEVPHMHLHILAGRSLGPMVGK